MANESTLNKMRKSLRFYYSKKEMMKIKFKENPTIENKEAFYSICDSFDDVLDNYYSNYIMSLKTKESKMFESMLSLPKETVKRNLLSDFLSKMENDKKELPTINEQKFNIHTQLKK